MRILALFLLIASGKFALSQTPEYYSYLVKGQVQYKKAKAKPTDLVPKTLLFREDLIILPKGKKTEITLVDTKSNYLVISDPGTYKIAELSQKAHKEPESITGKYFHMVWEELFQPQKDFGTFKKRNLPGLSGGVSRGDCDILKAPFNESIAGYGDILFSWKNFSTDMLYTFVLSDEKNNEVLRLKVRDTQLILNSASWLMGPRNRYYWKVTSNNSACTAFPSNDVRLWSNKEIIQRINEIKASVQNNGDSTLYQLQIAEILEKENMFDELGKFYQSAITQSADPVLRKAYASYLLRINREKEAERIYLQ